MSCALDDDRIGFAIGRRATPDDFPIVTSALVGHGRLQVTYTGDRALRPLMPGGFFDTERWISCLAVDAGDGGSDVRCLPWEGFSMWYGDAAWQFADDACTTPVLSTGGAPLGVSMVAHLDSMCGVRSRLRTIDVVEDYVGPLFTKDFDGACVARERVDGWRYYVSTGAVSLDTLLPITARTE